MSNPRANIFHILRTINWLTVNEVNRSKSTSRAKLKTASQKERIQKWKEYLKNLLGTAPKVNDKPITKIINSQQDIELGQFVEEELESTEKLRAENLQASMKYFWKYGRQGNVMTYFSHYAMLSNKIQ